MKREVMINAWKMFKKGYATTFATCLKTAWNLVKQLVTKCTNKIITTEKAVSELFNSDNKKARVLAIENNNFIMLGRKYVGECKYTHENFKFWSVKGKVRIYLEEFLDGVFIKSSYIEA